MKFSTSEINKLLGNINFNNAFKNNFYFRNASIDSRTIHPEDLFIALRGEKYDGHDFLQDVIKKGVRAIVINKRKQNLVPKNCPFWVVPDTKEAFLKLASFKRRKLNVPLVAITGSVGKTTTKEICLEVLKNYGEIKVSEKNNNNEIGVGLTIHSCDGSEDLIVLEMGMRGIGQIETLSKCSAPDIAVITNIGNSHIGLLGSKDRIAKAKCEITRYLNPNGVVIIPFGDPLLDENLKKVWGGRVLKVKIERENNKNKIYPLTKKYISGIFNSSNNSIEVDNKKFEISFKGIHNALNFLFVYAISQELGLKFEKYNKFNFRISDGRNKLIKTKKLTIMDESYNASPESVKACMNVLLDYSGRHFMIFGSMRELGNKSLSFHKEIIQLINNSDIKKCIFLCEKDLELKIRKSCFINKKILITNEIENIVLTINKITNEGDYLLIKGSRYWQLEKIIPLIE